jgi:hypothetical protein
MEVFDSASIQDRTVRVEVKVMLRPTVSRQSLMVSSTHMGLPTRFLLLSDTCGLVDVGRSLWRENGSAVYNSCWSSPAQSFLGPSPAGLVTIFYCLRFETPPIWRTRSPYLYRSGTRWPSYTPRHWVPFSSPPRTCRATVEVFEPAFTRDSPDRTVRVRVTLRLTVSQGLITRYYLLFDSYCLLLWTSRTLQKTRPLSSNVYPLLSHIVVQITLQRAV